MPICTDFFFFFFLIHIFSVHSAVCRFPHRWKESSGMNTLTRIWLMRTWTVSTIPMWLQGLVSWMLTTVKWWQFSQSNCHSTIGTRQTEYHEAVPSLANVQSHFVILSLSSADGGMMAALSSVDGGRPPWYRPQIICLVVCLLVACLTSQQQASVSRGRICTDNFTSCHTEI